MTPLRACVSSIATLLLVTSLATPSSAQTSPTDPLYQTISKLDTELFDAYNHCDLAKLGSLVTEDLEFYHDKTGLAVGRQPFLDAIKANICGKVTRQLVPGSLEVHPLNGYGAVEIGAHTFHHPGERDEHPGVAKFVMLWQQQKDGSWKISRVISYDHT